MPDTQREQFEKWKRTQPHCLGYPNCDGDLAGEEHETDCPMSKVPDSYGMSSTITAFSAYAAGVAAESEACLEIAKSGVSPLDITAAIRARRKESQGE